MQPRAVAGERLKKTCFFAARGLPMTLALASAACGGGKDGAPGPAGASGATGSAGATGATGATGPAGPGVTWVNVTGTTQQAAANTGYLADNAAQVTLTLPAAPALGDVVQVSGVGAGGWTLAQNAGQTVITKDILGNIGTGWLPRDVTRGWSCVASSADGRKLVAGTSGDTLFTSTDSGLSWSARGVTANWASVASSADGSKLVAAAFTE